MLGSQKRLEVLSLCLYEYSLLQKIHKNYFKLAKISSFEIFFLIVSIKPHTPYIPPANIETSYFNRVIRPTNWSLNELQKTQEIIGNSCIICILTKV